MSDDVRERARGLLSTNGEAGYVECHPDGSAEYQHFVAQAGPFDPGTRVVVLGKKEVDDLLALLGHPEGQEPERVEKDDEGRPYACGAFVADDRRWFCRLESDHGGDHEWVQYAPEPAALASPVGSPEGEESETECPSCGHTLGVYTDGGRVVAVLDLGTEGRASPVGSPEGQEPLGSGALLDEARLERRYDSDAAVITSTVHSPDRPEGES